MLRFHTQVLALLLTCAFTLAQTTVPSAQPLKPALLEGVGSLHHPVSTNNPEAQKYFDQGLNLLYGFNHDEAMRSFMKAAELDPKLAMAHWGIAMTLGPNYNVDVDPPREKAAYDEIQRARQLSSSAPAQEQAYINALAVRYSNDANPDLKKLALDYSKAMAELSRKYPDDLDAAALYAESLMLLSPWHLWTRDGKPEANTTQIVATLESVLKRDPDHIGANHLYIHAIEASPNPDRALESAGRLPGLAPASGHLVHMPAHIYGRTGEHDAAAGSNAAAAMADQQYLKDRNDDGIYPMVYYSHNLHFLAWSNLLQGRYADSIKAAQQLYQHVAPHLQHMAMLEGFAVARMQVMARFGKWDDILKQPQPGKELPGSLFTSHMVRSLAYAGLGKPDDAERERQMMIEVAKSAPPDAMVGMLNTLSSIAAVSDSYLAGHIAVAKKDDKSAITIFNKAAELEDALNYDEPPAWWFSVREDLGNALLRTGQAAEAEKVFRKGLDYSARDGRLLHGLLKSLQAQGRTYDAAWVEQQYKAAWKNADTKLE